MPGNEAADRAAKEAAGLYLVPKPEPLQILMATIKPTIHRTIRTEWERFWEVARHGRDLFRLRVRPGKATLATHRGTHQAISLVITQIRTSKISL